MTIPKHPVSISFCFKKFKMPLIIFKALPDASNKWLRYLLYLGNQSNVLYGCFSIKFCAKLYLYQCPVLHSLEVETTKGWPCLFVFQASRCFVPLSRNFDLSATWTLSEELMISRSSITVQLSVSVARSHITELTSRLNNALCENYNFAFCILETQEKIDFCPFSLTT